MSYTTKTFPDDKPLPPPAGEAPPEAKTRVGFDIDEVLVSCAEPYDYRADPASYSKLPLFAVFEALAVDPSFEVFLVTGRLHESIPTEMFEWVLVANPRVTLICREWDHPVDRLTPADKALPQANDFSADFLRKCDIWKRTVVQSLKLDVYFDDRDVSEYERWRQLARQFCRVR